ncbi:uncharacterized protein LOC123695177 [Colias croceus]|uniref:uncharacterized protein LOC123695177 n=1 Tax=Colias crocea TaxID=72248 RepID=UPI001E27F55D|nr:uncharacterized protein LOC123695177 [Colias croceus]
MDDEIEDIVGEVNYTDSQKSVTTSNVYSFDFTDSSSDRNNSSSKETYVIECDSDDSDKTFQIDQMEGTIDLRDKAATRVKVKQDKIIHKHEPNIIDRSVGSSSHQCSIVAQEIFTQTSKTIFELAQNEKRTSPVKFGEQNTLETQTSILSFTENRTVEYRIRVMGDNSIFPTNNALVYNSIIPTQIITTTLEDKSSIMLNSENEADMSKDYLTDETSKDKMIKFIDDISQESSSEEVNITQYENSSEFETSKYSDMEEDSLIENNYRAETERSQDKLSVNSDIPKSIDNDIEELYNKLSHSLNSTPQPESDMQSVIPNVGLLTPVTEETNLKVDGMTEMTSSLHNLNRPQEENDQFKIRNTLDDAQEKDKFRLPSIPNNFSCPNSPLNFLFAEDHREKSLNRWEIDTKGLASGESHFINIRNDVTLHNESIQLPPIHIEGPLKKATMVGKQVKRINEIQFENPSDTISIKERIRELKINPRRQRLENSRSASPRSTCSPDDSKLSDTAERGCDALCSELKRRLQINSWCQALETLEELPKVLDKFWSVITETRIADLIRQVTVHVESPRTQVARAACQTLAEILKNTNYTKKPDFYEAMAILLVKTGSYCRPVRRAANVALDDIVCSVDITHSVTAICVYGTGHKSALVRTASSRLLVVCAALAEGGRQLLRARPPTAAAARRHVLRAMADMLHDKSADTRKYAERLYAMLRPLTNFEAYFLTDVDVEMASKQMKKYDQLISSKQS